MHSSKRIKNQISCTQTCIFIQIRNSYSVKLSCIHKCILQAIKKKSNFMYSNMHFHSNSKFRFNKKFYAFINAPLKKKHQISYIQTCIFKIHIQSKISCIHKCIKQKIKFHAFLYPFFKKEQNQKFIFKQISCILTCILKKKSHCMHL